MLEEFCSKVCCMPQRFVLAILIFFAGVNAYLMRVVLSVAIIEMTLPVNKTALKPGEYCVKEENPGAKKQPLTNKTDAYDWDEATQGMLLSSFYVGYVMTHLPGGIWAEHHGGKHTLGFGLLLAGLLTITTPMVVQVSGWQGLLISRVLIGFGEGTTFPAMTCLMAHWIPKKERASLGSLSYSGVQIGTVFGNAVSGVLIGSTNSWQSIFYFYGILALVWYFLFITLCYSSPHQHPFISAKEKEYLDAEMNITLEARKIPWKAIMTSLPVWGLIICQFGHTWGLFTMVSILPKYMKSVLNFGTKESGLWSSLPYLVMWMVSLTSGCLCDYLITREYMTISVARKFFTTIAQLGPGAFILMAVYAGCNKALVILYFVIAMGTMGTFYAGMRVNCLDIAPNFAGTLMAIVNGLGASSGVIAPYLSGFLTPNQSFSEWKLVFWINGVMLTVTNFVFMAFGSGEVQPWNDGG